MKNVGCFKRDLAAQKIPPSEADWPRQRMKKPEYPAVSEAIYNGGHKLCESFVL